MSEQLQIGDFAPPLRPELSQWHTPVPLAEQMVRWAGIKHGDRVLEPCAGGGNLVRPLLDAGAHVTAVEIDPTWAALIPDAANVITGDFMDLAPGDFPVFDFDCAVQNPPFEDGQDVAWIDRALRFTPRTVALAPSRVLHGVDKHELVWSRHSLVGLVHLVRRPRFFGGGGKFDCVVVDVRRGRGHPFERLEWW